MSDNLKNSAKAAANTDTVPLQNSRPESREAASASSSPSPGMPETTPTETTPMHTRTWDPNLTRPLDVAEAARAEAQQAKTPRRKAFPTVPGYDVLSKLGEGGMGIVFKAIQLKANRLVALKMVSAGAGAGELQIERFMLEARASAQVDHPNIVRVFEVGEFEGLPFFSMEFCPGGALAGQLRGAPIPSRLAAQLIKSLAEALQTAHAVGIVHRDLKPANVLLAPNPAYQSSDWARFSSSSANVTMIGSERRTPNVPALPASYLADPNAFIPKIADFGLAKMLDTDASQTRTGAVMGTPSYMAPEQARGDTKKVGPRADVYSLGAILYELLSGRPPFVNTSALETLKQVVEVEPEPPSRWEPKTPRDLETICLKCLEKRPDKRYATALELAEDMGRFLSGEPIHARPAGPLERTAKWVRRRPALASIYALAVALLVALAFFNWRLTVQRNRANENLVRANENFALAMAAVDKFLTQVSDNPLLKENAFEDLRSDLLQGAVEFLERFVEVQGGDAEVVAEQGRACMRLALIQKTLQHRPEAVALNEKALTLFTGLSPSDQGAAALQRDLATVYHRLGNLHVENKADAQALTALQQALALRQSVAQGPDATNLDRVQLARTLTSLGALHDTAGRLPEAKASFERALETLQPIADREPNDAVVQDTLGQTHFNLAHLLLRPEIDTPNEARRHFEAAVQIWEKLPKRSEYQVNLAEALDSLAQLQNDSKDAIASLERAAAVWDEETHKHPGVQTYHVALTITRSKLAQTSYRQAKMAIDARRPEDKAAVLMQIERTLEHIRAYLAVAPNNVEGKKMSLVLQGERHFLEGRHVEAARMWIELGRLGSEEEQVRFGLLSGCGLLLKKGQIDEAARTAEDLGKNFTSGPAFYQAAALLARAGDAAAQNEDAAQAERDAVSAVAHLEKARLAGYFSLSVNRADLETQATWRALQTRQDFRAFLKKLADEPDPKK